MRLSLLGTGRGLRIRHAERNFFLIKLYKRVYLCILVMGGGSVNELTSCHGVYSLLLFRSYLMINQHSNSITVGTCLYVLLLVDSNEGRTVIVLNMINHRIHDYFGIDFLSSEILYHHYLCNQPV